MPYGDVRFKNVRLKMVDAGTPPPQHPPQGLSTSTPQQCSTAGGSSAASASSATTALFSEGDSVSGHWWGNWYPARVFSVTADTVTVLWDEGSISELRPDKVARSYVTSPAAELPPARAVPAATTTPPHTVGARTRTPSPVSKHINGTQASPQTDGRPLLQTRWEVRRESGEEQIQRILRSVEAKVREAQSRKDVFTVALEVIEAPDTEQPSS